MFKLLFKKLIEPKFVGDNLFWQSYMWFDLFILLSVIITSFCLEEILKI